MFKPLTPAVKILLIANIAIFFVDHSLLGGQLSNYFAYYNTFSDMHEPYQFFTYMFLHANFGHLFGNMLALFFFGPYIEEFFGSERFFKYYVLCGIGAGLLYGGASYFEALQIQNSFTMFQESPGLETFTNFINNHFSSIAHSSQVIKIREGLKYENVDAVEAAFSLARELYNINVTSGRMVGASGAVFGLYTVMYVYFGEQRVFIFPLPIPIKIKYFVLFYGLYSIYGAIHKTPGDNVAHLAHLGGLGVGYVLLWIIRKPWNKIL